MTLSNIAEKYVLVKEELGSGKTYQAAQISKEYNRVVWLTSSRLLAQHTCTRIKFVNYQEVPKSQPLSLIDKIVILSPSLYRMYYNFTPYDLLIVDEAESVLQDVFSGLCSGPAFEHQM